MNRMAKVRPLFPPASFSAVDPRKGRWLAALLLGLCLPLWAAAQVGAAAAPTSLRTITNPDEVWLMTTEERARCYPLRLEGRVNFFDPMWGNLWFEHEGVGRFVHLGSKPPLMRNGQRVLIEGTYVPVEGLDAGRVQVTVLKDFEPIEPVSTAGRISEVRLFDRKVVTLEGYVDEQQLMDSQHLRLMLIVEDRRVICWVPPEPHRALPDWQRHFIRVTAVYSGRLDATGTDSTVELWTARQADLVELGTIEADPQFVRPPVAIGSLSETPPGTEVLVRGTIQRRESGAQIVLRDSTGEVTVNSLQRERFPAGVEVEAVGRTGISGSRWVIESGLVRQASTVAHAPSRPRRGRCRGWS
ncbi:MAG: hypothetical protein IPL39_13125 [Opitutaceae bacterium]|nr:hypothetical protein [Opitutaceae bacterium]